MSESQRKLLKALIVGKPNVGKSTLLNSIVGEKVSIVSRKAQTTQKNTTGVITKDNNQLIFIILQLSKKNSIVEYSLICSNNFKINVNCSYEKAVIFFSVYSTFFCL